MAGQPISVSRMAPRGMITSSSGQRFTMVDLDEKFAVFRQGFEGISQDLYDYVTYPAAGTTGLNFFQVPIGQSTKTLADTNMINQGQLPQSQKFLVTGIRVDFLPANVASSTGAVVAANANDMKAVGETGALQFTIGVKTYHQGAPLKSYPVGYRIGGDFALSDTTTAAAARVTKVDLAYWAGEVRQINPVLIPSNESFNVSMQWPTAVSITTQARIGVRLDGILFRRSQ